VREIDSVVRSVEARGFKALCARNSDEARNIILHLISPDSVVGIGDSSSVRQIGVITQLRNRGTQVIDPFDPSRTITDVESFRRLVFIPMIKATICDVFLTGANAVTADGRLMSIDGTGNRVAGTFWGHQASIVVVGRNKIVKDLDEARYRLKNVIVPYHSKRRGLTAPPCSSTGTCVDCVGKNRACSVTTMVEARPRFTEITVVLVNEDLGLSWDEHWPKDRIERIVANYQRYMWTYDPEIVRGIDGKEFWRSVHTTVEVVDRASCTTGKRFP